MVNVAHIGHLLTRLVWLKLNLFVFFSGESAVVIGDQHSGSSVELFLKVIADVWEWRQSHPTRPYSAEQRYKLVAIFSSAQRLCTLCLFTYHEPLMPWHLHSRLISLDTCYRTKNRSKRFVQIIQIIDKLIKYELVCDHSDSELVIAFRVMSRLKGL